jgi:hypothetical protein
MEEDKVEEEWKCIFNGVEITDTDIRNLTPEQLIQLTMELIQWISRMQQEEEEMLSKILEVKLRRLCMLEDEP